jgi:triacylglycerol lipase
MNKVDNELICANLCNLAYKDNVDDQFIQTFNELGITILNDITFLQKDWNEGFVLLWKDKLYISIRGLDDIQDVIDDMNIILTPFYINHIYCGKVHSGFYKDYLIISELLKEHIKTYIENGGTTIVFTGHSSGASIQFLALECSFLYPAANITCYTFGSPKLGDEDFAKLFDSRLKEVSRFYIDIDVVPRVPFGNTYKHIGNPILLKDKGSFSWFMIYLSLATFLVKKTLFNKYVLYGHSLLTYITKLKELYKVS